MSFDTRIRALRTRIRPLVEVILATQLILEVSPRGQLTAVRGCGEYLDRFAAKAKDCVPPGLKHAAEVTDALRSILEERSVRELLWLVFLPYPEGALQPESTWEDEGRLRVEAIDLKLQTTCTLCKPPWGAARWRISGRTRLHPPPPAPGFDVEMPVGVYEFDARIDPATGWSANRRFGHWFDLNYFETAGAARKCVRSTSCEVKGFAAFWREE
jgi:hypothetical protein